MGRFRLLNFFLLLIIFISKDSYSKKAVAPTPRAGLTFLNQGFSLNENKHYTLHVSSPIEWTHADFNMSVISVNEYNQTSEAKAVVMPVKRVRLTQASLSKDISLLIKKNGEYLIQIKVSFYNHYSKLKELSLAVGVLAQNGFVWLGNGSVENAFVEKEKIRLGIKGAPSGESLNKLNKSLKIWVENRQKTINKNQGR